MLTEEDGGSDLRESNPHVVRPAFRELWRMVGVRRERGNRPELDRKAETVRVSQTVSIEPEPEDVAVMRCTHRPEQGRAAAGASPPARQDVTGTVVRSDLELPALCADRDKAIARVVAVRPHRRSDREADRPRVVVRDDDVSDVFRAAGVVLGVGEPRQIRSEGRRRSQCGADERKKNQPVQPRGEVRRFRHREDNRPVRRPAFRPVSAQFAVRLHGTRTYGDPYRWVSERRLRYGFRKTSQAPRPPLPLLSGRSSFDSAKPAGQLRQHRDRDSGLLLEELQERPPR